jgi:PST family polysaccharide transporter
VTAIRGLFIPFSQALYPVVSKKLHEDPRRGLKSLQRFSLLTAAVTAVISALLYFFSEITVVWLYGVSFVDSVSVLKILAPLPFLVSLSTIFGVHGLLNLGRQRQFMTILASAGSIGLVLSFVLVPKYGLIGTAVTTLAVEVLVTSVMFVSLWFFREDVCRKSSIRSDRLID